MIRTLFGTVCKSWWSLNYFPIACRFLTCVWTRGRNVQRARSGCLQAARRRCCIRSKSRLQKNKIFKKRWSQTGVLIIKIYQFSLEVSLTWGQGRRAVWASWGSGPTAPARAALPPLRMLPPLTSAFPDFYICIKRHKKLTLKWYKKIETHDVCRNFIEYENKLGVIAFNFFNSQSSRT